MHPELIKVLGFPIHSYGFMLVVGFVLALYVASRRAKVMGIKPEFITDMAIWAIICGIIGARVFYIFEPKDAGAEETFKGGWKVFNVFDGNMSWLGALAGAALVGIILAAWQWLARGKIRFKNENGGLRARPVAWIAIAVIVVAVIGSRAWELGLGTYQTVENGSTVTKALNENYNFQYFYIHSGGLTFYGGLVPTAILLIFITWRSRYGVWLMADVIAPSVMLGLAFGRVGCFLNGCCWGRVAESGFWGSLAVRFPRGSDIFKVHEVFHPEVHDTGYSLSVVPTQIISSFAAFGLFLFLSWFFWKRRRDGEVFVLMCGMYAAFRFLIEFVRDDTPHNLLGMTFSQVIGIGVVVASLIIFLVLRFKPKDTVGTETA